jgi:hypothetical protein
MRGKQAFALAALGVFGLSAALAVAYFVARMDPAAQPGQTWRHDAFTAGQDIRLLDSGEYVARIWCDVCKGRTSRGRWSREGAIITLTPAEPGKPRSVLRREHLLGCQLLTPVNVPADSDVFSATYTRQGDTCENRL